MTKKILFTLTVLLIALNVLLLSACTSKGEAENQACIVGTWQLSGNEAFSKALLPADAFEQESVTFVDAGGVIAYSFDNQGKIFVDSPAWMSQLSVLVEQKNYPLDLQMMGDASGAYRLEGDRVSVTAVDYSNLAFEAYLDGEPMLQSLSADDFAPLFMSNYSTAHLECTQSTLRLTILDKPGFNEMIEFQRVNLEQE
jgi:hypothetical protein